ncbi:hypothetical protein ONA91_32195 [Micromonospora sp. DR5-3]|uniref:hypothetical protein n=1 Tax=unclassified Micromonospora TaxID=2617518 RepID=UPI001652434A|nr:MULTISPECIES: hypothetical protein [unclassified Micromonospora]MCW3819111.1 hypothetical protein [Micromonospora sp. DR5-3]
MHGQVQIIADTTESVAVHQPIASTAMKLRIVLSLAALATLLYTVGAPYEHGG